MVRLDLRDQPVLMARTALTVNLVRKAQQVHRETLARRVFQDNRQAQMGLKVPWNLQGRKVFRDRMAPKVIQVQ